ncbi:MAG: hypothetical protein ACREJ4_07670 [Candidatus Methylomirabilaceae bacterium]
MIVEAPHGGALGPSAGAHPHPHPDRFRCTSDQRIEACYAFRDQPGGVYLIQVASDADLEELLRQTPVLEGAVREVWALREV